MMPRKESLLQVKSEAFAGRIAKLYLYLKNEKQESVMSKQIYRSGTSIGANIAESSYHDNIEIGKMLTSSILTVKKKNGLL